MAQYSVERKQAILNKLLSPELIIVKTELYQATFNTILKRIKIA